MLRINYYPLLHLLYLCLSMSWEIVGKLTYIQKHQWIYYNGGLSVLLPTANLLDDGPDLVAGFCQRSVGSCLDFYHTRDVLGKCLLLVPNYITSYFLDVPSYLRPVISQPQRDRRFGSDARVIGVLFETVKNP